MSLILKITRFILGTLLFVVALAMFWGCEPENPGEKLANLPPQVRLANVPVNDPLTHPLDDTATVGTDGLWRVYTDINGNGMWDVNEPLNDDVGSDGLAPGDSGYAGPDVDGTQGNGRPNLGEPHVYPYRLASGSPIVSLYWVGNDGDGFVTGFAYRWTYKEKMTDSVWKYNPGNPLDPTDPTYKWKVIVNYVIPSSSGTKNLVLMMELDTATARIAVPSVFKFFSNASLDPERLDRNNRNADTALIRIYDQLDSGKTVLVNGYPVYASNPPKVTYPVHDSPNRGQFVFESDDKKNRHIFEIVAIDNEGAIGKRDTINFWTPGVEIPILNITKDPGREKIFVLKQKTYTWPGIRFEFRGRDRNSRTFEYSWRVDTKDWSPWSSETYAAVTALDMDTPYTGPHIFRVRCRNEFGAVTQENINLTRIFYTVYPLFVEPNFPQRTLLIHHSRLSAVDYSYRPDLNHIVEYYRVLMDSLGIPYDVWITRQRGNPSFEDLARYSSVYIITDQFVLDGIETGILKGRIYYQYLDVGGRLVLNGIFSRGGNLLNVIDDVFRDSVLVKRMHLFTASPLRNSEPQPGIFVRAVGALGYPDLQIDTTKLAPFQRALQNVAVNRPRGFGEIIYRFDAVDDNFLFENQPIGIRYDGITFKTVYLGFPVYFMEQRQAVAVLRRAFKDIGQLAP